jgi:trans-aconitate 2-methyltransferase
MTALDTWDPRQYSKFERQREQPFYDLLALVQPGAGMCVVDLGCGTGKLTRVLHGRLGARDTAGIDSSASMLASADAEPKPDGLRFEVGTIEAFAERRLDRGERPDLIFSNAALHWVEDHDSIVPRLAALLADDGQIAFQMPAQHDDVTHVTAVRLADEEPYRSALGGWRKPQPVLTPDAYSRLLYRCGFADPTVRLIVYPHVLEAREAVVDWFKGSLLTEYARHLPPDLFEHFVADYRARLLPRLDAARPFFFPFKRILCWGRRTAP